MQRILTFLDFLRQQISVFAKCSRHLLKRVEVLTMTLRLKANEVLNNWAGARLQYRQTDLPQFWAYERSLPAVVGLAAAVLLLLRSSS